MKRKLVEYSAYALMELIKKGEAKVCDIVEECIACIEKNNPKLHALLYFCPERARKEALLCDEKIALKQPLDPLFGIPLIVPDLYGIKGIPTTYGSPLFKDNIAKEDDEEIAYLHDLGAIIIGKGNIGEFNTSPETYNQLEPPCRHPLNPKYSPGGPRGGAAAAVKVGFALIALGGDSCGAVRMAASICGIYGLVPTRGFADLKKNHFLPYSEEHFFRKGILAKDTRDIKLMLDVIKKKNIQQVSKAPHALTIGWLQTFHFLSIDDEVAANMEKSAKALQDVGHIVKKIHVDLNPDYFQHFRHIFCADRYLIIMNLIKEIPGAYEQLTQHTKKVLAAGDAVTGVQYAMAIAYSQWLEELINKLFTTYDLLLLPAVPTPAYPLGHPPTNLGRGGIDPDLGLFCFTLPFNMSGHPAIAVPWGTDSKGFPLGFQLVGPFFSEELLLDVSSQLARNP